ncbi:30098_t:CDS:1, partial [Racocetra persica]
PYSLKLYSGHYANYPELETKLVDWIASIQDKGYAISQYMITKRAKLSQ